MNFVDHVHVLVRAGHGGDGVVAWRREPHTPKGGPAGGDGGDGGDVVLVADESLSTLLDLKYRPQLRAQRGQPGSTKQKNGKAGEDLEVRVPLGTVVTRIAEVLDEDDRPPWVRLAGEVDDGEGMENIWVGGSRPSYGSDADDPTDGVAGHEPAGEVDADEASDEDEPDDGAGAARRGATRRVPGGATATPMASDPEVGDEGDEGDGGDEPPALQGFRPFRAPAATAVAQPPAPPRVKPVPVEEVEDALEIEGLRVFSEPGQRVGDLTDHGQRLVVAEGGQGGRGNIHFRSSTNRAPDRAEPGTPGQAYWLRLELKLLADVGIVGFPNVGKSTLISRISRARPKIADYPFTTLVPNLGVVSLDRERTMVVADVPGLIEGASEGRGLGLAFLRHLERTRVLLHVLAPDPTPGRAPLADLDAIEAELLAYGEVFRDKPRVVALNKLDALGDDEGRRLVARTRKALRARDIPLFTISATTGEGVAPLLEALWRRLAALPR
jgi:GTP-binding protein